MEGIPLKKNDNITLTSDIFTDVEIKLWKYIGSDYYNNFIGYITNTTDRNFQYISGSLKSGQEDHVIYIKKGDIYFTIPTTVFKDHFKKATTGGFKKRKSIRKNKKRSRRARRTRRVLTHALA